MNLIRARVDAPPTTAYLMVGERCAFDCGFCPQAKGASSRVEMLSRVTWPEFDEDEVLRALAGRRAAEAFKRVCVQVVHGGGALRRAENLVRAMTSAARNVSGPGLPVSVSVHVGGLSDAVRLFEAGAERLGLPVDAATPSVYSRVKGGSWERAVARVWEVAAAFPGRVGTHLVAGLGETEEEMARAIQAMYDCGVTVGLFAFTPVKGTRMEAVRPPPMDSYRRLQVVHFLIRTGRSRAERMTFRDGMITGYGLDARELVAALRSGGAFLTTGCPGCNRPYYNERPGRTLYNYPSGPDPAEIEAAIRCSMPVTEGESAE
jgi:biotin synthase